MALQHKVATTAATSAQMDAVRDLLRDARSGHEGRADLVDSLTGAYVVVLGNGALLRDVVDSLDRAGWIA